MRSRAISIIILILLTASAWAASYGPLDGNPNDTPTGTTITALATMETISYKDQSGGVMPTAECATGSVSKTVTSEYGLTALTLIADLLVTPGDVIYQYYITTSEANANDANVVLKSWWKKFGSGGTWTVEAWVSGEAKGILTAETVCQFPRTLYDNSDLPFYYRVTVPVNAGSDSYIYIYSTVETASTPNGQYNYAYGDTYRYGGPGTVSDEVKDYTALPSMTLARTSTVDAPTSLGGDAHRAFPGSAVTYTLTFSNTGNGTAENVIIVDRVPPKANLAHFNRFGSAGGIDVTASKGNFYPVLIYYSTLESPNKTYGNTTDWIYIDGLGSQSDMLPGFGMYGYAGGGPWNAKWVKWEITTVEAGATGKTVTWGVTIR